MNKIRRFFNQNKRRILIALAFIGFVIIIIQILNKQAEKSLNEKKISSNDNTENLSRKSIISGYEIGKTSYAIQTSLISNFVEYCNNKEIKKAYDLISSDCKEELYPTLQDFKKYYYDNIFTEKRIYSTKNWANSIFIVKYSEDILSSGKVNSNSTIQDYITIVEENGQLKLNLNSYLGKKEINIEENNQNVKIKVLQKRSYIEHEIYDFEVENNVGNTILLDTLVYNNRTYLTDNNGTNHYSINNEISRELLLVKDKYKNKISIKFDNPYIWDRKIKSISFKDIAVCYENNILGDYIKKINLTINL